VGADSFDSLYQRPTAVKNAGSRNFLEDLVLLGPRDGRQPSWKLFSPRRRVFCEGYFPSFNRPGSRFFSRYRRLATRSLFVDF